MLFAEICDFYELPAGCKVSNEGFAQRLGCTARSVRNWLAELKEHGLVSRTEEGGNRFLEPRIPSWITIETEGEGRKTRSTEEESFQDGRDLRKDASQEGGKFVPTQRDNKPAEAGEGARPRGEDPVEDAPEWAPTLGEVKTWLNNNMTGISEDTAETWFYHRKEHNWENCTPKWEVNLQKWHSREPKFSHDGAPAGNDDSPVMDANGKATRPAPPKV
jgi:DNA-binding transcriptional ArsR family regulator